MIRTAFFGMASLLNLTELAQATKLVAQTELEQSEEDLSFPEFA